MNGIALHESEKPFQPMWQRPAIVAMDDRLVPDVVSHIFKVDRASLSVCLSQQGGDVRALHEAIAGARTPDVGGDLVNGEPCGGSDPGYGLDLDGQYEQPLVYRPVVFEVPHEHGRSVALRSR